MITIDMSQTEDGMARGTRVFTQSGEEIEDVSRIEITMSAADDFAIARIDVLVSNKSDLSGMLAKLGYNTLKQAAEDSGYTLTRQGK